MEQVAMQNLGKPLLPSWQHCVSAGAARNGLRADWQRQLTQVVHQCGFRTLRMDGLPAEWQHQYQALDALLDFLLDTEVRPFWRMHPTQAHEARALSDAVRHAIARYGASEVQSWRFELPAGTGYTLGYTTLKQLDPALCCGGAVSPERMENACVAWRRSCTRPDFVTLQCFATPTLACLSTARQTLERVLPDTPLHLDASRADPGGVGVLEQAAGLAALHIYGGALAESLSCTHFSGLSGAPLSILDPHGVLQPLCHVYRFLCTLGSTELSRGPGWLVTRTTQGRARALFYCEAFHTPETLLLTGCAPYARFLAEAVDGAHGWAMSAWERMGSPLNPTRIQTQALQRAALDTSVSWHTADAFGTLHYTPPASATLVSLREP